jgi:hypothetical protein
MYSNSSDGIQMHTADDSVQDEESVSNNPRLGPAGLSLHYANVVMQIDNLVSAIYFHHVCLTIIFKVCNY